MKKTQIILFYLILIFLLTSTLSFPYSEVFAILIMPMIVGSIYISIKHNTIYIIRRVILGKFEIINIEALLTIAVVFIFLRNINIGLEKNELTRDFFNFYYLLAIPFYLLSMFRLRKS